MISRTIATTAIISGGFTGAVTYFALPAREVTVERPFKTYEEALKSGRNFCKFMANIVEEATNPENYRGEEFEQEVRKDIQLLHQHRPNYLALGLDHCEREMKEALDMYNNQKFFKRIIDKSGEKSLKQGLFNY